MSCFIVEGRSTGKTRRLIEYAKENNATVVCKNSAAMARKAAAYGIFGVKFKDYAEVVVELQEELGSIGDFVVDEAKDFMDFVLASNCVGFTQTVD